MNYLLHNIVMISVYAILAMSLNLLLGYTGMLSLCHAAFAAAGAYTSAMLATQLGWSFPAAAALSMVVAALLAALVGLPTLRFRGDFFVLATIGFQTIIYTFLYNAVSLTGGPYGISGIPRPSWLGFAATSLPTLAALAFSSAVFSLLFFLWLSRLPYGLTLQTIRDDEIAAEALGRNAYAYKSSAFIIGAAMAAFAGSLYGSYVTYIDPTSFNLDQSILILTAVVIGGAGNIRGPILGASLILILPELLRSVDILGTSAPNARQIIYGFLIVMMMRFRPQGIAGRYAFD